MAYRGEFGESFQLDASSCKYPGCTRPRYREPYGFIHEFCGKTHATAYNQMISVKKSSGLSDFKPKRSGHDKRTSQGRVTPTKADHKVDHCYMYNGTSIKSQYNSDIKFYNSYEPYYQFTNFAQFPIQLDGKLWPTTEHYFQAQKFVGTPYEEAIRKQPSARTAFDLSRNPSVHHWIRGDWNQTKNDIMLKCLRAKFTQHNDLQKLLLSTGDRKLVEHTANDSYWGDGGDGSGQNNLGKLLMKVRDELPKDHRFSSSLASQPTSSLVRTEHKKNKHTRRNSISGMSTVPIGNTTALLSISSSLTGSQRKFRSTENIHQLLSRPTGMAATLSSPYTFGETSNRFPSSSSYKPTVKRSNSHGNLNSKKLDAGGSLSGTKSHRNKMTMSTNGQLITQANQSSVPYNIITNV